MWEFTKIVALAILAAIVYGVVHDQITARICVEYFTIGHPPIFGTDDPTLLGLGWGVIATWWVGLILGCMLAAAARVGRWPRMRAAELCRPLMFTLAIVGAIAVLSGVVGYATAVRGFIPIATRVPPERHVAFITNLWIHNASYLAGGLAGVVLCVWVLRVRYRAASTSPSTPVHR